MLNGVGFFLKGRSGLTLSGFADGVKLGGHGVIKNDATVLMRVDTRLWGGLLVTLVVSVTGIVTSMPVGIALALGRRSTIPLIRVFSVAFIGVEVGSSPRITVMRD